MTTTLIQNVHLAGSNDANCRIYIQDDIIAAIGNDESVPTEADIVIDAHGALAMPGAIDCHVHFREPGMTHKADIASESRAAIAGGVTSYLEMPNTKPSTITIAKWEEKMDIASKNSMANYSFFIGATNDNINELKKADYTRIPGVKVFMGSSTGNMLVDDDQTITRIFKEIDAIVAVHAEDQDIIAKLTEQYSANAVNGDLPVEYHSMIRPVEACYKSTKKAVDLALKYNHRLHICHITTAAELSLLQPGDPATKLITSEVSPHHLMWDSNDYSHRGTRIKMNPSVKSSEDRIALTEALKTGLIDMVATDHAPHLLEEKKGGALKAVSGAPLVQFSLPWLLDHFDETTVQRVMCTNPSDVYHIDRRGRLAKGHYADIVLIEKCEPYEIKDVDALSKCGWTPLVGTTLSHRVTQTWINGSLVYDNGVLTGKQAAMPLRFGK